MAYCPKCGTAVIKQANYTPQRQERYPFGSFAIAVVVVLAALIIILAALILTGFIPIVGQFGENPGNVQTQQCTFTDFSAVDAGNGFDVVITQGSNYSVAITTNENVMQTIDARLVGQTLVLGVNGIHISTTLKAEITMPDLTAVVLSGGSKADITGFNMTHNFTADLSGGSRITMAGQAVDLTAGGAGGSNLNFSGFEVNNAQINLSGGSQATVNAKGELNADLSGGSQLFYRGNPTLGNVDSSGGSSIYQIP